jgi:hypothetical protein
MEYNPPQDEQQLVALHECVKSVDPNSLNKSDIDSLGRILATSDSAGLRDIIAYKFSHANKPACIPYLIESLKRNIRTNHISTIIYACSNYNCSEYLQVFADLLMLKQDMSFVDAWYTIENMRGPVPDPEILYAVNKLKAFLASKDRAYHLYDEIEKAVRIIESINDKSHFIR